MQVNFRCTDTIYNQLYKASTDPDPKEKETAKDLSEHTISAPENISMLAETTSDSGLTETELILLRDRAVGGASPEAVFGLCT